MSEAILVLDMTNDSIAPTARSVDLRKQILPRTADVDSLMLIGWSTSLAVLSTALDAWQLGYPTTVVSDLTVAHAWGGRSVEDNQRWSLDFIKAFAMSRLATTEELIR
jgi:nicotinamidase-related amidase